jgi:hypothetical protein
MDRVIEIPELIDQICMVLPCKYVIIFSLCSKQLNNIIKDYGLISKRKKLGFPRIGGHCFSYDASKYMYLKPSRCDNYCGLDNYYSGRLLDVLIRCNINLVRGDLIYRGLDEKLNKGICIFDGCKIINLDDNDNSDYSDNGQIGSLPSQFSPIINGVNIDYWKTIYDEDGNILERGLYSRDAWFDICELKPQLINNVKLERNNIVIDKYNTKFTYNNIEYYILLPYCLLFYDNSEEILKSFNGLITSQSKLLLDYDGPIKLFEKTINNNDNILFLHQCYLDEEIKYYHYCRLR